MGTVYDVAVDLRRTLLHIKNGVVLNFLLKIRNNFIFQKAFAHGFIVLSEIAEFFYKVTDFWHSNDEGGLLWNDPDINVEWPIDKFSQILLSDKDKKKSYF